MRRLIRRISWIAPLSLFANIVCKMLQKLPCFRDKMANILGISQLNAHFNNMSKYPQLFDGFARYVDFHDLSTKAENMRYTKKGIYPKYTKTCMGFVQLPLMGWGMLIFGTIILILSVSLKIQSSRLQAEKEAHQATQLAYRTFVSEVKRLGEEQEAKVKKEKARQQQVNKERAKTYEKRIADIASAYQRLLGESSGAGGRELPAVPSTARAVDDAARDQQLSTVLRHADEQTARLIELQRWIADQGKLTP